MDSIHPPYDGTGEGIVFRRNDQLSPSQWSRLTPAEKFGVILIGGAAVGGVIGGIWGAGAGIAEAGSANLLAGLIISDAVWPGSLLGVTLGGASGTVVGAPFLFLEPQRNAPPPGNALSCPIPK